MQNKVVVIYRNDEVAHAAANALLEEGFPFDRIYISSDDDVKQVRYYDRIGEDRLLPQLENDLGRFYRSIADMDNVPETTGLYTRALKDGYVIVSIDTDSYRDAMKAAKTMCRFETLGIGSFSSKDETLFDTEKNTVIPAISETGVFVLGQYPEQKDLPATQQSLARQSSGTGKKWRWLSRQAVERIERAMDKASQNIMHAAGSASDAMEKVAGKTSSALKKASHSIRDLFERDTRTADEQAAAIDENDKETSGEKAFRNHWRHHYLPSGIPYDNCRPAYRYGARLAQEGKKDASTWEQIEPIAHAGWDRDHHDHGQSWEAGRDAIRFGWSHTMNAR